MAIDNDAFPSDGGANATSNTTLELRDLNDFLNIAAPNGLVSIGGFGSLLSGFICCFQHKKNFRHHIHSALTKIFDTFVCLRLAVGYIVPNGALAKLWGFRRVFRHVAPIFFKRGIANLETKEISSVSVEPCDGEFTIITVFEINVSEVPAFIEREHEFRFLAVFPEALDGTIYSQPVVVCASSTDEEYHEHYCKGSKEIFFNQYGRYGIDKIWRDDILPCRIYLRHCVLAAKNLGNEVLDNFLDHTYLGNRKTTIRQHLRNHPELMEEEPPPLLKERYGG